MTFGVSALGCRLDASVAAWDDPEVAQWVVDWTDLLGWGGPRAFAGKYFIASPWRWVHGEGTTRVDPAVPGASLAIAPIQASDAVRQAEPGGLGQQWGGEDGDALAEAIGSAIMVGDLALSGASDRVNVYLEVDASTALSAEYWAGWAAAVSTALLVGDQTISGFDVPLLQGLLPCLATTFVASTANPNQWEAPQAIRDALDGSATVGWASARCHGFWARTPDPATIEATPALDWSSFTEYSQKQRSGPDVPVPVQIWRYATGDPQAPIHQVGKVTLEATQATSGDPDPVLDAMLSAQAWSASARPSLIGVDRGAALSREIKCLSGHRLTVGHLPEMNDAGVAGPALTPALAAPASFAARYYSAGPLSDGSPPPRDPKDLSRAEAGILSLASVDIVSTWQSRVLYTEAPAHLTAPGSGYADGGGAGWFAATQARQPAHRPIYFAIDCDVTTSGVSSVPNNGAISDAELIDYFTDIAQGLADYLANQDKETRVPYAIGVYSCAHAFDVLYPRGLASHFWQANPGFWGDAQPGAHTNATAWARANLWQVGMDRIGSVQVSSGLAACRVVFTWILLVNDQPGPAQIQVTVGGNVTNLAFPPTAAMLASATGAKVTIVIPQTGITEFKMDFAAAPVGLDIESLGGESAGFEMDLVEQGLADLNVSWGDPAGWRAPQGGA